MSTGHRWLLALVGVLWVAVGVFFFVEPAGMLYTLTLVLAFGLMALGVIEAIAWASMPKGYPRRGWVLARGIISILLGILCLIAPLAAIITLPYILAAYMLIANVLEIAASFSVRSAGMKSWWWLLISGVLGVIIAIIIFFFPVFAASTVFGAFFVFYGLFYVIGAITNRLPEEA